MAVLFRCGLCLLLAVIFYCSACAPRDRTTATVTRTESASLDAEPLPQNDTTVVVNNPDDDDDDGEGKGIFGILADIITLPFRALAAIF